MPDAAPRQPSGARGAVARGVGNINLSDRSPAGPTTAPRSRTTRAADARWVEAARYAAVVAFPGLGLFAAAAPERAGRVFWTVAIAALPLVFVLAGYHRWRRICPLAFIAQLPARVGLAGQRRAGPWLQAHAYHLALVIFVVSLWLRLIATNGDGIAIAVFLLAISGAAIAVGLLFTGKTWCNYVCPVSFVEKLYTEPRGLRDTPNSQCGTCTACRPACPDINEENSYWKEILLPAKRDVYFAFPGIVLAFYAYYFLQSGTWAYYFEGGWTREPGLFRTAFAPGTNAQTAGFYFWPAVPRAAAAALTLIAGGLLSHVAFRALEPMLGRALRRRSTSVDASGLRSVAFTIAAFAAFVAFYSFAGAPTLRLVPGLPHVFQLVIVTTATVVFIRRVGRRQSAFAEETLARKLVANWKWTDVPPPKDLREAFLIHTIRSQSQDDARRQMLDLYKSAIRDSLDSGMISRREVHRLDALRHQLHISDADHELAMSELADEGGGLAASEARAASPEKQLQLDTYTEALAVHLERREQAASDVESALVRELRTRYGVTVDEHAAVIERLLRSDGLAAHLTGVPAAIEWLAAAVRRFEPMPSPAARFLVRLLRRRWTRAADSLVRTLAGDVPAAEALRDALLSDEADARDIVLGVVGSLVSPSTATSLAGALTRARGDLGDSPDIARLLRAQLSSPEPYLRATALYLLESMDQASTDEFDRLEADEHPVVRETAAAARAVSLGAVPAEATTLEKMIGLRSVAIFDDLEPEDLAQLARAGAEVWFTEGECLCREGEPGDEVFVLLDGQVAVSHGGALTTEGPGSCIGELAVLDPAPREATVIACTIAVRALRLTGGSFRQALGASPVASEGIIRSLARRLREARGAGVLKG
jgi:hypothetical protein